MTLETRVDGTRRSHIRACVPAALFLLLAFGGTALVSAPAAVTAVFDALAAVMVLGPAVLAGYVLLSMFGVQNVPRAWRLMLAAALGVGVTGLFVLALGMLGAFRRNAALVLLAIMAAGGVLLIRSRKYSRRTENSEDAPPPSPAILDSRLLWVLFPFLTLGLLAATNAPGFLWQEEGWGYDILEYHLQIPKEYLLRGGIEYLPHNVYANFPSQVEMLYLLLMTVLDSTVDAGTVCNMVHLCLGGLAVFAGWTIARDWSPGAGAAAAVLLGSAGWVSYLGGLAYVELGMLFFGTTAVGALLAAMRAERPSAESEVNTKQALHATPQQDHSLPDKERQYIERGRTGDNPVPHTKAGRHDPMADSGRMLLLSGVLAGWACGCKYTAVPMIALPIVLVVAVMVRGSMPVRVGRVAIWSVGCVAALSPWLIKNFVYTGNPVFPLANGVFRAAPEGFGPEETAHWDAGHAPKTEERSLGARAQMLWSHVLADRDQRFGPAVFIIALLGLRRGLWRTACRTSSGAGCTGYKPAPHIDALPNRQAAASSWGRIDAALWLMFAVQFVVWIGFTHLFARFAVVWLIPLALLGGRAMVTARSTAMHRVMVVLVVLGAGWNFAFAARLHHRENPGGIPAVLMYSGEIPGFEYYGVVNQELPADARVMLVGEARAFYFQRPVEYWTAFNRNPFLEQIAAGKSGGELIDWLREREVTHVLVHWTEIERIASTYGFAPTVSPEKIKAGLEAMKPSGLELMGEFGLPKRMGRYVKLYRVHWRSRL